MTRNLRVGGGFCLVVFGGFFGKTGLCFTSIMYFLKDYLNSV